MADEVEQKSGIRPEQFLVQEMVNGGIEMILGMHRDSLGSAIMLGMGGVTAELLADTAIRMLPESGSLSPVEARAMARGSIRRPPAWNSKCRCGPVE